MPEPHGHRRVDAATSRDTSGAPLTTLRGAGVDVDVRRAAHVVVGLCLVALAVRRRRALRGRRPQERADQHASPARRGGEGHRVAVPRSAGGQRQQRGRATRAVERSPSTAIAISEAIPGNVLRPPGSTVRAVGCRGQPAPAVDRPCRGDRARVVRACSSSRPSCSWSWSLARRSPGLQAPAAARHGGGRRTTVAALRCRRDGALAFPDARRSRSRRLGRRPAPIEPRGTACCSPCPGSSSDADKAPLGERLRDAILKPVDPGRRRKAKAGRRKPVSVEELEDAVKYADDKERLMGLLLAPVAAAIGLLVINDLISHDPASS